MPFGQLTVFFICTNVSEIIRRMIAQFLVAWQPSLLFCDFAEHCHCTCRVRLSVRHPGPFFPRHRQRIFNVDDMTTASWWRHGHLSSRDSRQPSRRLSPLEIKITTTYACKVTVNYIILRYNYIGFIYRFLNHSSITIVLEHTLEHVKHIVPIRAILKCNTHSKF